jgi:hypothetical protein
VRTYLDAAMDCSAPNHPLINFTLRASLALTAFILGFRLVGPSALPHWEDDAYYYIVIARNLSDSGVSTFDGTTATNGYHPLWLVVLYLQYLSTSKSLLITSLIELASVCAGLFFIIKTLDRRSFWLYPVYSAAYLISARSAAMNGMETSILLLFFGLTVYTVDRSRALNESWLAAAMCGALAIGARLDAAFFVLPLLAFGLPGRVAKIKALALVAALGLIYVVINRVFFGVSLPISGNIKSLGGLQLNRALISQLAERWFGLGLTSDLRTILLDPVFHQLVFFLLAPALLLITKKGSMARILVAAYALGFFMYAGKLLFFSSWRSWPWYDYPRVFAVTAAFFALADLTKGSLIPWPRGRSLAAVGLLLLLVMAGREIMREPNPPRPSDQLNALAVKQLTALGTETVAMGDRAGSFAYMFPGRVFQLEGLVEDKDYFDVIANRGDVKGELCKRNVRFIVDYEVDLGSYSEHTIKILRPRLTSFEGPTIKVSSNDQVARIYDLAVHDNSSFDEGDNFIYVWRLTGCPS